MELSERNNHFNFLEKLSYENKAKVLLGDFNDSGLNCNLNIDISHLLGHLYCSSVCLHNISPKRITARSKTLIDNMFSNADESTVKLEIF